MFESKKISKLAIAVVATLLVLSGCNNNLGNYTSPTYPDHDIPAQVRIKLKADTTYQNVEYHIDHINNRIYNSQYLPFGTKLDSAYLEIIVSSKVKVQVENVTTQSVKDWNSSSANKTLVDVKGGKLRLVMQLNDKLSKTYDLRIMSYGYDPYKLTWKKSTDKLAKAYSDVKVVTLNGQDFYIGRYQTAVDLYRINSLEPFVATSEVASFPAGLIPSSLVVTDSGTAWAMTDGGALYRSKDLKAWTAVPMNGVKCTMVLFEPLNQMAVDKMVIIGEESGAHSFYIADGSTLTKEHSIPAGFPVKGAFVHDYKVSNIAKAVVLGGLTADGSVVKSSFFTSDGINWAPTPYSSGTISVPKTAGLYLSSTDEKRLFLIGGSYATASESSALKVSDDHGITWTKITGDNTLGDKLTQHLNAGGIVKSVNGGDMIYVIGGTVDGAPTTDIWKGWLDTSKGIINAFE